MDIIIPITAPAITHLMGGAITLHAIVADLNFAQRAKLHVRNSLG